MSCTQCLSEGETRGGGQGCVPPARTSLGAGPLSPNHQPPFSSHWEATGNPCQGDPGRWEGAGGLTWDSGSMSPNRIFLLPPSLLR